ncbi:MAG: glutamate--tRNA ligase [Pseudomonadota bacterium]|nr:glutamate--tRNA ligase [Pseudomonadota bacterium]
MTTVRFAPSPTGHIHIGNARTALLNWLLALKTGGQFILRFDDTDRDRSKPEYAAAIAADLAWLGIHPHRVEHQSERVDRYAAAAERLKARGRLYACYETADELERRRKRQLTRGQPPVYDRAALQLSPQQREEFAAEGRKPHWRFKLDHRNVAWDDLVRGRQHIDTATLSDPVLVREDGSFLYTLTSVVDDIEFGISHVIRGEDHVVNTAVQIEITEALGGSVPHYAHHSLLTGADGKGLSKRLGSLSIAGLREAGIDARAIASHAALLGTSDPVAPHARMETLVQGFDLAKLSRAPARFAESELQALNAKLLHGLPYAEVADKLSALAISGGEALWNAVRGNITVLAEVKDWQRIVNGDIAPAIADGDRAFLARAREALPPDPWDAGTWSQWTGALKNTETARQGKQLFMPLRMALTGREHGPELAALLPLIGRQRALERLGT